MACCAGSRAGYKQQGSRGSEAADMTALQQHIDDLTQVRHANSCLTPSL